MEDAVRIYVGKRGSTKAFQQAEIDALLVQHCLQARTGFATMVAALLLSIKSRR